MLCLLLWYIDLCTYNLDMWSTFCVWVLVYPNWRYFMFWQVLYNYFRTEWRWASRVSCVSLNGMCACWITNIRYYCRDRDVIFEVQRWSRLVLCSIAPNLFKIFSFFKKIVEFLKVNGQVILHLYLYIGLQLGGIQFWVLVRNQLSRGYAHLSSLLLFKLCSSLN
jgi:hypothetical protein